MTLLIALIVIATALIGLFSGFGFEIVKLPMRHRIAAISCC